MTILTDNFNRADENLQASADWDTLTDHGTLAIRSNEVSMITNGVGGQGFNASAVLAGTVADDQSAQVAVTVRSQGVRAWAGLLLRVQSNDDYYLIQARVGTNTADDEVVVYRRVGASFTSLGSYDPGAWTIPFTLYAEAVGSQIVVKVDGATVITATPDSTHQTGVVGIQLNHDPADGSPAASNLRVDNFSGGDLVAPLNVPWTHSFWADQPGFTPPADGASIPGAPANLGSAGAFVDSTAPTWVDDMAGSGKPAIQTIGEDGIRKVESTNAYPTRTIVIVGRVLGTTDADLFDTPNGRSLVDVSGGLWRLFSGAIQQTAGADTDLHMFVATFGDGATDSLEIDQATVISGNAGTNSGGGRLMFGHSDLGDGNTDGTQVAFAGFIDRVLTAQEKADLWAWYEAEYQAVGGVGGLYVGGQVPSAIYVGSQAVTAVYKGSELVWP